MFHESCDGVDLLSTGLEAKHRQGALIHLDAAIVHIAQWLHRHFLCVGAAGTLFHATQHFGEVVRPCSTTRELRRVHVIDNGSVAAGMWKSLMNMRNALYEAPRHA